MSYHLNHIPSLLKTNLNLKDCSEQLFSAIPFEYLDLKLNIYNFWFYSILSLTENLLRFPNRIGQCWKFKWISVLYLRSKNPKEL